VKHSRLARLVAVVDTDEAWCRRVARRFGVPQAYTDARKLIGQVDAAIIATPNFTHVNLATLLLDHGIHVLCEKPVCTSLPELARVVASADRRGARFMAAHCLRFGSNLLFLKRMIDEGWLGEVQEIKAAIGSPYDEAAHRTDFRRARRSAGGGVLADLGIHLIDLSLWLTGRLPARVTHRAEFVRGWEVEDNAEVILHFPAGIKAQLSCSFTERLSNTLRVRCSSGWAEVSLYVQNRLELFTEKLRMCRSDGAQMLVAEGPDMYRAQIDHFCQAITSGGHLHVPDSDVRTGIAILQQCYEPSACLVAP